MADFFYCNEWSYFEFPLNVLSGILFVLGIVVLSVFYSDKVWVKRVSGVGFTLVWISVFVLILVIEGVFALKLYRTWPFIVLLLVFLLHLGMVIVRHMRRWNFRNVLFLFNHAGLWITIAAALLGIPDMKAVKMIAPLGRPEYMTIDVKGRVYPLPFTVTLQEFVAEYYQDRQSMPKSFRSELFLQSQDKKSRVTLEVNKPVRFGGYTIYQDGYDPAKGSDSEYVILQLVRDPWIVLVYLGIMMMLAGSLGLIVYGPIKKKKYGIRLE